jgi:hypothetical protein
MGNATLGAWNRAPLDVTAFPFYGTFTSGQPGHANPAGATLLDQTRTAPRYRLYDVDGLPALVPAERA